MVRIKPFKGIRPPKELASEVASRPYDVLNSVEAKAEAGERSLLHIIKPEIDFDPIADEHSQEAYEKAMENFRLWKEKGWLAQDDEEYQLSLIINQKITMLVILNPELQLYAYRKYQLPENMPRVDTKLYMAGWKPSQAASGWRVVNPFYDKK